jgi:transposase
VRKQKTDRQGAQLLLQLLMENRFPRIWVPDAENRDLRQLLWHRHRLVQMRMRIMNQLHVVALNEGVRGKKALWRPTGRSQLESLGLAPWASRRRQDLLDLLDQLTPKIHELTRALEEMVEKRTVARRLRTHPGVGPLTALAFELVIGTPEAQPVFPSGHAAQAKDREGRDGPETCGAVVLDVAARMESRRNEKARFARGRARKSPWCAVITDVMIGYPAPLRRGVRSSNHDRGCDRRDGWVGLSV